MALAFRGGIAADTSRFRCGLARRAPAWPVLAGIWGLVVAMLRPGVLDDPDTYLHIVSGRWMLAHRMLPSSDPFSHSMPQAHWVVHEWLAELVLGLTYAGLGWNGLMVLTAGCFGLGTGLLTWFLLRHGDRLVALLLAAAATLLLEVHLLARPHLIALPVMVAWCGALVEARDAKRWPPWRLLPLITLWANLHGSFVVGLGLAGFLGVEAMLERPVSWARELRRWGGFAVLATGAALIDPNGIDTLLLPIRLVRMTVLRDSFNEWLSPNFHNFQPLELWILALLYVGYALRLQLPLPRLVFSLGLVHLALQAGRHGDLLAVLLPLLVAAPFTAQIRPRRTAQAAPLPLRFAPSRQDRSIRALVAAMLVAIMVGLRFATPIERHDGAATPASAMAAAQRMGVSGPVLNAEQFGGYLIFLGVPTFIDGRAEMYGADFLKRYLDATNGDEAVLTALLDQYRITWTIFEPKSAAALILERLPGWRRVYRDDFAVIDQRIDVSGRASATAAASTSFGGR